MKLDGEKPSVASPQTYALITMAFNQADLDTLDRAIATGELSVSYGGRSSTFRSIKELIAARDLVSRELAKPQLGQAPTFGGRGFSLARFD
ncbi:MAG: hypothetical protein EOP24_26720 [Hyphomicrobiales bacterium]|nr:MAG: hypothetical protein EOP24_26720 [Hyphomicrobiales bacterium]